MKALVTNLHYLSRVLNFLTGGNYQEYYCARILKEKKINQVLFINWTWWILFKDEMHCQRVFYNQNKNLK